MLSGSDGYHHTQEHTLHYFVESIYNLLSLNENSTYVTTAISASFKTCMIVMMTVSIIVNNLQHDYVLVK